MFKNLHRKSGLRHSAFLLGLFTASFTAGSQQQPQARFHLQDASIAGIQQAILTGQITTAGLVELYLKRIKTYNNTCVNEPLGILGPITTIPRPT